MRELRFRRRARDHVRAIARSLEGERSGYGLLFVESVTDVVRLIAEGPDSFPAVPERAGVRKGVLRSPFGKYVVYFRSGERLTTVLAVLHGARHPDTWERGER